MKIPPGRFIDFREVEIDGTPCLITIEADLDSSVDDDDCYSPADVQAWLDGLWRYVGVTLQTATGTASTWAVEYGQMPARHIDLDSLIRDPCPFLDDQACTLPQLLLSELS